MLGHVISHVACTQSLARLNISTVRRAERTFPGAAYYYSWGSRIMRTQKPRIRRIMILFDKMISRRVCRFCNDSLPIHF